LCRPGRRTQGTAVNDPVSVEHFGNDFDGEVVVGRIALSPDQPDSDAGIPGRSATRREDDRPQSIAAIYGLEDTVAPGRPIAGACRRGSRALISIYELKSGGSARRPTFGGRASFPLTSGARLGPYEIVSSLGAGGMGEVYRARDTKLNRDVAIKVLPDMSES
jgi:hypothetical protein